jgi:large subunit ribosomal protein L17
LLRHERIETTLPKAKEAQRLTERLITLGKRGSVSDRRRAIALLNDSPLVGRLFSDIAPRFSNRPGGYTRILRGGYRAGDGASMAFIELVELAPRTKRVPERKRQQTPPPAPESKKAPEEKKRQEPPEKPPQPKGFLEGLRQFFKKRPQP